MAKKTVKTEEVLEEVSSSNTSKMADDYADKAIKKIDKIIKVISFVVSIGILLIFLAASAILFMMDNSFYLLAIGIFVVGLVISLITLFLIYGLGHIITQNNEILKKLK